MAHRISKKAARELLETIEDYAEATANRYWMDDQGTGPAVDDARRAYDKSREHLLADLNLTEGDTK